VNIKPIALLAVFPLFFSHMLRATEQKSDNLTAEEFIYFLNHPIEVAGAVYEEVLSPSALYAAYQRGWKKQAPLALDQEIPTLDIVFQEVNQEIEAIEKVEEIREINKIETITETVNLDNEIINAVIEVPEEVTHEESPLVVTDSVIAPLPAHSVFSEEIIQDDQAVITVRSIIDASALNESFTTQLQTFSTIGTQIFEKINPRFSVLGYAGGDKVKAGGPWIKIMGQHAIQKEHQTVPGYHSDMGGLISGADVFHEEGGLGVALSWSHLNIRHQPIANTKTQVDSYQFAGYGNYQSRPFYLDWLAALAYNDYAYHQSAKAQRYHGWQYGIKAETGMNISRKAFYVIPFASLYYSYLDLHPYAERDGSVNQSIVLKDMQMLQGGIGAKWVAEALFFNRHVWMQSEYCMMAFYDFIGDRMEATSQLTGAGPSFVTLGFKPAKTSYLVGVTLSTFMLKEGIVLTSSYDFSFKAHYVAHTGFLKLHIQW